jgi:hypothetical protein
LSESASELIIEAVIFYSCILSNFFPLKLLMYLVTLSESYSTLKKKRKAGFPRVQRIFLFFGVLLENCMSIDCFPCTFMHHSYLYFGFGKHFVIYASLVCYVDTLMEKD